MNDDHAQDQDRPVPWPCPICDGGFPGDVPDTLVCQCGQAGWGAPFPKAKLAGPEWEHLTTMLVTRSGGACEARTPACLAYRDGRLLGTPHSRHHRKNRQSGGSGDPLINSLANLLLLCGDGTTGCHGWIGANPEQAYRLGLLVPHGVGPACDPAKVPVVMHGGRRRLLDPTNPCYLDPEDGVLYAS